MKKILLVYPPFCTPASPPYSITRLYAFLKNNLPEGHKVDVIDLNIEFHKRKFREFQQYYQHLKEDYDPGRYDKKTKEFQDLSKKAYNENNKRIVAGKVPELFEELLNIVKDKKPDIAAFSIVYSSQAFYAYGFIKELNKIGIKTIIGGPAINSKLKSAASQALNNELELLESITGKKASHDSLNCSMALDFSIYSKEDYFSPELVIPIRTSNTCYYRQCAFCTHYAGGGYYEFHMGDISETVKKSGCKKFFIIDDMLHKKRLLELAGVFRPLKISWTCQLRPTKELDSKTLKELHASGLKMIMWGVESGCDRVLVKMGKGTNRKDVAEVLRNSSESGIKNVVYIIFGFPTETKEDFLETISFLKGNSQNIDLVSTSIFGLQKGSRVYENPAEFGITRIKQEKRTILEPRISYEAKEGLTQEMAEKMRKGHKRTLEKLNKYPKNMNFFREHMLCIIE